jgi:hypothetical protein
MSGRSVEKVLFPGDHLGSAVRLSRRWEVRNAVSPSIAKIAEASQIAGVRE